MPTGVHRIFIDGVEDAIRCQLKTICGGSDKAALFAQLHRDLFSSRRRSAYHKVKTRPSGEGGESGKVLGLEEEGEPQGDGESDSDGDGELDGDAESKGVGESGEDDETGSNRLTDRKQRS
ncbi:hypothetical protein GP486_001600, partial [Trichoglossum hirsutum]